MAHFPEAQSALDKAKIQLMMKPDSVFFTTITFSLKHIWDDTIPTACTNGLEIRYSPKFFMDLDTDEQQFLVLHETLHVAFQHMVRRGSRDPLRWNIAADYAINLILVKQGFKMPKGGLLDYQYDGMTVDQIYDLLDDDQDPDDLPMSDLDEPDDGDSQDGPGSPGAPGQSGSGNASPMTASEIGDKIDDILIKAKLQAEMSGKSAGNIPGELDFYIQSLLTPKLPWNQLLQKFMSKIVKRGYTWKRPNRRFFPRHYLPSRLSKSTCHLAVAIDTSVSVSDDEFHRFASEVYSILKNQRPEALTIIQFDTEIKRVDEIRKPEDLQKLGFKGRGGTDIHPVIDWAAQNKPTALLIFSDGYFSQRFENPKVPLIWLINNNEGFQTKYGKVVHYEYQ